MVRQAGLLFSRSFFQLSFLARLPGVSAHQELGAARYRGLALLLSDFQSLIHLPVYALAASHFPLLCICRCVMGLEASGHRRHPGGSGKGAALCLLAAFELSWC